MGRGGYLWHQVPLECQVCPGGGYVRGVCPGGVLGVWVCPGGAAGMPRWGVKRTLVVFIWSH